MSDFRTKLAAVVGYGHKLLFYAPGCRKPPYNELSVAESLKEFCSTVLPMSPLKTPRGAQIKLVKTNFPKLAGLEHKTHSKAVFSASDIIREIENGAFEQENYDSDRDDRLRTLFWLPELLRDPDAIYQNAHKIVAGDLVYVRVYNKMGSTVKLAFTLDIKKRGRLISTVVITSFLTDPATAISYVKGDPIYLRPQRLLVQ